MHRFLFLYITNYYKRVNNSIHVIFLGCQLSFIRQKNPRNTYILSILNVHNQTHLSFGSLNSKKEKTRIWLDFPKLNVCCGKEKLKLDIQDKEQENFCYCYEIQQRGLLRWVLGVAGAIGAICTDTAQRQRERGQ